MSYNPIIHHRHSIRLKGYDYSQAGLYFVTICCQDRVCRFGNIENGEMILNDAGQMVEKWRAELSNKFPDIKLDTYVIMPNHFHAIIENTGNIAVGADLRVCPDELGEHGGEHGGNILGEHGGNILGEYGENILGEYGGEHGENILGEHGDEYEGEHIGSPLRAVIQWFKTMTTNEYIRGVKTLGWQRFDKKLWQRNYWERIIRDEQSYQRIANYIINNPANWGKDKFYNK